MSHPGRRPSWLTDEAMANAIPINDAARQARAARGPAACCPNCGTPAFLHKRLGGCSRIHAQTGQPVADPRRTP